MRCAIVGFGDEEGARDLLGRQAAEQAQRERDARLGREHRMAGDEHEPQQVVADVVVERRVEIGHGRSLLRPRARGRARSCLRSSSALRRKQVDRAVLRGGHEPGAGIVRHARLAATARARRRARPARGPRRAPTSRTMRASPAISFGRFDPPDRVDRAMCVGSRHGHRSHHLRSRKPQCGSAIRAAGAQRVSCFLAIRSRGRAAPAPAARA